MIITRTPYRISFLGGGTDYPGWFRQHGGAVISTSIDKYCYLTCRNLPPFFEHRYRIVYSRTEECSRAEEIQHPAVREGLKFHGITQGIELHHDGDLPARSGMGSSSSFAVGLMQILHALQNGMASKEQLAREAINLEQNILQENVGSQDQISAAYGGFNHITFLQNDEFVVRPIILGRDRMAQFQGHFMLFFTGINRTASDVASSFVPNIEDKKRQLRVLRDLVEEGMALLSGGADLAGFGELMHEAWLAKKSLSDLISNGEVDRVYDCARAAGALGGKLIGAGGGGFLLLYVPPAKHDDVRQSLPGLIHVPFQFESEGSRILFYDLDQDYAETAARRENQAVSSFREWQKAPAENPVLAA
jgi:D-glycero-alpha-D-manno-heptose-7-phosphate kinase